MPIAGVVADANVILSALIGKAALRVCTGFGLDVHMARHCEAEVREYIPRLFSRYGLPLELVEIRWRILEVRVHPESDYVAHFAKAKADMESRDPDDAHPLALARTLRLPLWTNDHDLFGRGVTSYPTARLLAILDRQGPSTP